jgi:hypothetical protein
MLLLFEIPNSEILADPSLGENAIEVECSADTRHMRERLREIAKRLSINTKHRHRVSPPPSG